MHQIPAVNDIIELSNHLSRYDRLFVQDIISKIIDISNEPGINIHELRQILYEINNQIEENL